MGPMQCYVGNINDFSVVIFSIAVKLVIVLACSVKRVFAVARSAVVSVVQRDLEEQEPTYGPIVIHRTPRERFDLQRAVKIAISGGQYGGGVLLETVETPSSGHQSSLRIR